MINMTNRNRSEGWTYAKKSGHKNEDLVKELIDKNPKFAHSILKITQNDDFKIIKSSIGGIKEKDVMGVNNKKTKSKTDLKLYLNNGKNINISIKKSLGGQVYLVSAPIFINTFEKQFNTSIPQTVKQGINLFWSNDNNATNIINTYANHSNSKSFDLQMKHSSLNATTLQNYNITIYKDLLNWFTTFSYEIAQLCFSMGATKNKDDWAEYIWYINLLKEDYTSTTNKLFKISDLCTLCKKYSNNQTFYGKVNEGTTIQLPFGFAEWHQHKIQFHHKFDKINNLFKSDFNKINF